MANGFTCTNELYNNIGPRYIHDKEALDSIEDTYIKLSCYVEDFFNAVEELKEVDNKTIEYIVKISDNWKNYIYKNPFDSFDKLGLYNDNIIELVMDLSKKTPNNKFKKLMFFLNCINHKLSLTFKLPSLEIFNIEQLLLLKNLNENINTTFKINQTYKGDCFGGNDGSDNIYTLDKLIQIKQKINEIINKMPDDYTDVEKILFLYKYLGKKVTYDERIANLSHSKRQFHDTNSIYDVLFNNKGVCSSFATTLRVLLNATGYECYTLFGNEHEWNIVKLGNYWYHLDLTWDLDNIRNNLGLEYFLKSGQYISKDKTHQTHAYFRYKNKVAKKSISKNLYSIKI